MKYLSDGGYGEEGQTVRKKRKKSNSLKPALKEPQNKKRKANTSASTNAKKRQRTTRGHAEKNLSSRKNHEDIVVWLSASDREVLLAAPIFKKGSSDTVVITGNHASKQSSFKTAKMDERHDSAVVADGFDLNNISSVAGLLSSEHIDTLKAILQAQGLDPEALDVVLKDLIEGREPEFEEEEEQVVGHEASSQHEKDGAT